MGGNSMGLTGLETPDASRPGGPTCAANLPLGIGDDGDQEAQQQGAEPNDFV